jgi:septum formation protein
VTARTAMPPLPLPPASFVYLASQSPRRRQLLDQIGVRHELLLPAPGEDAEALEAELPGESPDDYVRRVALAKLAAATARLRARGLAPAPVLCADTVVALDGAVLGKPRDAADALATLRRLAGRTHHVITAVAVADARYAGPHDTDPCGADPHDADRPDTEAPVREGGPPPGIHFAVSVSQVRFAPVASAALERYVASGEPFGKAGAYAVQSAAAAWIERIEGSYSGIMGLPLHETALLLRDAGIDV